MPIANPTLAGSGTAGDTISVLDQNNTLLCTTTVLSTGAWSCKISVLNGNYDLRATQMSGAGVSSPDSTPFAFSGADAKRAGYPVAAVTDDSNTSDHFRHGFVADRG